tara:strand:+ start:326 stop:1501 length:1176 start_codon:yes stop_codon:yes gene_type:complete
MNLKNNNIKKKVIDLVSDVVGKGPKALHIPLIKEIERNYVLKCLKTNVVSSVGEYTNKFEKLLKNFTKAKYVLLVNSGTSSLHLSMMGCDLKNNDEVLMPAFNFIASANAVSYLGGIPHFVEIENKTLGIDPKKLEKYLKKILIKKGRFYINKITKNKVKAIIVTHVFGHAAKIDYLIRLLKKYKIFIVEDASEALGSYYKNKHLGTFADIGTLSFNGNKIITTGGGGAILTNNKKIFEKLKHISTTAKRKHRWEYSYDKIGYNYRMPSINAALGCAQLKNLNNFIKAKRKLYIKYKENLKNDAHLEIFKEPKNCKSNYWLQSLLLKTKNKKLQEKILKKLNDLGYSCRPPWNLLISNSPYKSNPSMNLNVSKEMRYKIINLPSSPSIILK